MLYAEIYEGFCTNDRIIMDILSPNPEDEILEIGVGTGAYAKRIAPLVKRYVGIDIAPRTIKALREHLKNHNIEFRCFDMCDEIILSELRTRFTKAYSFDTLEHVECPQRFFKNLALMLSPNGEAIVSFPNESPPKMHGITSFRVLGDVLRLLEDTSLKVVRVYEVRKSFLSKNISQFLWDPVVKVGKFILAPRNYRPQCFDDTIAVRFIIRPSMVGKLLNTYAYLLIKIASIRPLFHYIPLVEKENLEILDKRILLHLRLQKRLLV